MNKVVGVDFVFKCLCCFMVVQLFLYLPLSISLFLICFDSILFPVFLIVLMACTLVVDPCVLVIFLLCLII